MTTWVTYNKEKEWDNDIKCKLFKHMLKYPDKSESELCAEFASNNNLQFLARKPTILIVG